MANPDGKSESFHGTRIRTVAKAAQVISVPPHSFGPSRLAQSTERSVRLEADRSILVTKRGDERSDRMPVPEPPKCCGSGPTHDGLLIHQPTDKREQRARIAQLAKGVSSSAADALIAVLQGLNERGDGTTIVQVPQAGTSFAAR